MPTLSDSQTDMPCMPRKAQCCWLAPRSAMDLVAPSPSVCPSPYCGLLKVFVPVPSSSVCVCAHLCTWSEHLWVRVHMCGVCEHVCVCMWSERAGWAQLQLPAFALTHQVAPQPLWFSDTVANLRKLSELPWHLLHAGRLEELRQEVLGKDRNREGPTGAPASPPASWSPQSTKG